MISDGKPQTDFAQSQGYLVRHSERKEEEASGAFHRLVSGDDNHREHVANGTEDQSEEGKHADEFFGMGSFED